MALDRGQGWAGNAGDAYERGLVGPVFRPYGQELARRVAALRPGAVLELAAGSGALTRELLGVGLDRVTATDLSPSMAEVGATHAPGAEWRTADAQALPFEDGAFDVVVSQFGAMFFPERVAAFAESRRVLAEGGTMLVATWGALARHTYQDAVHRAGAAVLPQDPPRYLELPHSCHDPERLAEEVRAAGFSSAAGETVTLSTTAPSLEDLVRGYCFGTPLRGQLEARGDVGELTTAIVEVVRAELGPDPVAGTMDAALVTATW